MRLREIKSWMPHFGRWKNKEATGGSAFKVLSEHKQSSRKNEAKHFSAAASFPSAHPAPTCSCLSESLKCHVKDTLVSLAWPMQSHVIRWGNFILSSASLCNFRATSISFKIDFLPIKFSTWCISLFLKMELTLAILHFWVFCTPRICSGKDNLASLREDPSIPKDDQTLLPSSW